mgnify:FL=1
MKKIVEAVKNPRPEGAIPVVDMDLPSVRAITERLVDVDLRLSSQIQEINTTLLSLATHLQGLETPTPIVEVVEEPEPVNDWNPEKSSMLLWKTKKDGISWDNHYQGSKIFLVCSGPSLKDLNLSLLDNRGVVTMAINNSWCMVKPDLWIGFDVPGRFHNDGWMDPSIMKIVPWHNRDLNINHRVGDDIVDTGLTLSLIHI